MTWRLWPILISCIQIHYLWWIYHPNEIGKVSWEWTSARQWSSFYSSLCFGGRVLYCCWVNVCTSLMGLCCNFHHSICWGLEERVYDVYWLPYNESKYSLKSIHPRVCLQREPSMYHSPSHLPRHTHASWKLGHSSTAPAPHFPHNQQKVICAGGDPREWGMGGTKEDGVV